MKRTNPNPSPTGTIGERWGSDLSQNGGDGEIRTLAGVTPTNGLANRPLRPTWVRLRKIYKHIVFAFLSFVNS